MAYSFDLIPMDKFRSGDKAVFEFVYNELKSEVYGYCLKLVRNEHDAENLVSQAFLQLYVCRATVDNPRHLKRRVFKIAHDRAIDYLKTRLRESPSTPFIEANADDLADPQSDPSLENVDLERQRLLESIISFARKAVAEMPNEYGRVFRLIAVEGRKFTDVAALRGTSILTIYAQMGTAKKHLKKSLEDQGFPPALLIKKNFSYLIGQLKRINI